MKKPRYIIKNASGHSFENLFKSSTEKEEDEKDDKTPKTEDKNKPKDKPPEDIDYKSKYESLSRFDNEGVEEFFKTVDDDYEGETIIEKLSNHVEKVKSLRLSEEQAGRVEGLEQELEDRDSKLREINIVNSNEWKEEVAKPKQIAIDAFSATLTEVDASGKALYPNEARSLVNAIWNEGKEMSAAQIKGVVKEFSKVYEDKLGEEYLAPTISEIIRARNEVVAAVENETEVYKNWEDKQKEKSDKGIIRDEEESKKLLSAMSSSRKREYDRVFKDFKYDDLSTHFKKDKVQETLKSIYEDNEKMFNGDTEQLSYSELVESLLKARLFDDLLNDAKNDRNFVSEYKDEDNKEGKPGKASDQKPKDTDKIDIFGMHE